MGTTTGTSDLTSITADEIRAAAREQNAAEFPEALPLVESGRTVLLATVLYADRAQSAYRILVSPCVRATVDGREVTVGGLDPVVLVEAHRLPARGSMFENAQRRYGSRLRGAQVPVQWFDRESWAR